MYNNAKKLSIISGILKVKSLDTLIQLEEILKPLNNKKLPNKKKLTILDFAGIITDQEAIEMKKAINEIQ